MSSRPGGALNVRPPSFHILGFYRGEITRRVPFSQESANPLADGRTRRTLRLPSSNISSRYPVSTSLSGASRPVSQFPPVFVCDLTGWNNFLSHVDFAKFPAAQSEAGETLQGPWETAWGVVKPPFPPRGKQFLQPVRRKLTATR